MSAGISAENIGPVHGGANYSKVSHDSPHRKVELSRRSSVNASSDDQHSKSARSSKRRRRKTESEQNGSDEANTKSEHTGDKSKVGTPNGAAETQLSRKLDGRKMYRYAAEKPARKRLGRRLEQSNGKDESADVVEPRTLKSAKNYRADFNAGKVEKTEKNLKIGDKLNADIKQKDIKPEKQLRIEEKDKAAGKLDKNGDRERAQSEKEISRPSYGERLVNTEETRASDSESDGNESDNGNGERESSSGSDSEEDLMELDRRKAEKVDDLAELERQFRDLRDALFTERLAAIDDRLADVRNERATEFDVPRTALREALDTRVNVAKQVRKFRAEFEAQRNSATRRASTLSAEERKRVAVETLRDEVCAQIRSLFERVRRDQHMQTRKAAQRSTALAKRVSSKRARNQPALQSESSSDSEARTNRATRQTEDCDDEEADIGHVPKVPAQPRTQEPRRSIAARRQRAKRAAKRKVNEPFIIYQLSADEIQDDMLRIRVAAMRGQPYYPAAPLNYATPFGGSLANTAQQTGAGSLMTLSGTQRSAMHGTVLQFGISSAIASSGPQAVARTSVVT